MKLEQYSGTAMHGAVKSFGKMVGKSFKPWEAVKWTRTIANAGRALAVVGTVLTFYLQYREDVNAEEYEQDLKESRSAIRNGFDEAANVIEMHFSETTGRFIRNTFDAELKEIDNQLEELQSLQGARTDLFQTVETLLSDNRSLITKIQSLSSL